MRRVLCRLAGLAILLVLPLAALAQVDRLQGRFFGVTEAQGMEIELSRKGNRIVGRFIDSNGVEAPIDAEIQDTAAQALLTFPARKVLIRLFPESIGLRLIAIPLDETGAPQIEAANALVFLPQGTKVPEIPEGYMEPAFKVRVADPDSFLISYEFWPPEGVAFGWESLEARYRPLITVFPVVLTDILWKLCTSTYQPAALAEALRGQGVTCDQVVKKIAQIQRKGKFEEYKAAVAAEKKVALDAVRCARGYTVKPEICKPASRRVAEAAVSLVTVGAVLKRF